MPQYFAYGQKEMDYLCAKDPRLGEVIRAIGLIRREVTPDLFASLVDSIISQQISGKAAQTVCERLTALVGQITPAAICAEGVESIQGCGMSLRKAGYILSAAEAVQSGQLNLEALQHLPDEEVIRQLSALYGIGRWTAEMLMIFSMQRPDIFSYDDFGIRKGVRMVYHHREITKAQFEKYRRRLSPYCSVASLYFWHVAGGALGLQDYAPLTEAEKKKRKKQREAAKKNAIQEDTL